MVSGPDFPWKIHHGLHRTLLDAEALSIGSFATMMADGTLVNTHLRAARSGDAPQVKYRMGVPPKSSILIGCSIKAIQLLGYPHFGKLPDS